MTAFQAWVDLDSSSETDIFWILKMRKPWNGKWGFWSWKGDCFAFKMYFFNVHIPSFNWQLPSIRFSLPKTAFIKKWYILWYILQANSDQINDTFLLRLLFFIMINSCYRRYHKGDKLFPVYKFFSLRESAVLSHWHNPDTTCGKAGAG